MLSEREIPKLERLSIEQTRLGLARVALQGMDGLFGPTVRKLNTPLVSNDEGWKFGVLPRLHEIQKRQGRCGIGLFIGSGGVLSILPELSVELPVVVDRNVAVLELSRLLERLIVGENSPKAVMKRLNSSRFIYKNDFLREYVETIREDDYIVGYIDGVNGESRNYGMYHWTNRQRFPYVQAALRRYPIVHIVADLRNSDFASAFSEISTENRLPITFANLTNVHNWLKPSSMDFMRHYPFDDEALIVYSSHKGYLSNYPVSRMVTGIDEYIQQADDDDKDLSDALID